MSARFLTDYCEYLERATRAAPSTLPDLARELHRAQLRLLPVDSLYEPLACPLHGMAGPEDLFPVPEENAFFIDLAGPREAQDVLCARELRARIWALVDRPAVRIWLVTDAYTGAGRGALLVERCPPDNAFRIRALFVGERDLVAGVLFEVLLLAILGLADRRGAEVRVDPEATPLVRLCYAATGFLRHGDGLVRPPMSTLAGSDETLRAVERQLTAQWAAHCDERLA